MHPPNTDLFGQPIPPLLKKPGRPRLNPCLAVWGPGPAGATCGACRHHYFRRLARAYPKCDRRGDTGSARTDHSSRYPACGEFIAKAVNP